MTGRGELKTRAGIFECGLKLHIGESAIPETNSSGYSCSNLPLTPKTRHLIRSKVVTKVVTKVVKVVLHNGFNANGLDSQFCDLALHFHLFLRVSFALPLAMNPDTANRPIEPVSRASGVQLLREVALDFPTGDGRVGRCRARLFLAPDVATPDPLDGATPAPALVVALVGQPRGGGGWELSNYAPTIATTLCAQESLAPDRLIYIDHDEERGTRLAQWAVMMGPDALVAMGAAASRGEALGEGFALVAFDFAAGALVNPRFTPLSRFDAEELIGGSFNVPR